MKPPAAIVVTFHPDARAYDSLVALAEQARPLIVVDNSATQASRSRLTRAFGERADTVTLLFNPENLGVAAALNIGLRAAAAAGAEWALTLDQDSRVTPHLAETLAAALAALPPAERERTAVLAPELLAPGGSLSAVRSVPSDAASREADTAVTSGCLVRLAAWQAVGGFDERLFIDYVDHDFCFRLRRAGWAVRTCGGARLLHAIGNATLVRRFGRTLSVNQHSPLRFYYIVRNGLLFWRTYRGDSRFLRQDQLNTFKLLVKALLFDTRRCERLRLCWQAARDYRQGRFGRYDRLHGDPCP